MLNLLLKNHIQCLLGVMFVWVPMIVEATPPYHLSIESTLQSRLESEIIPYWQATTKLGQFSGMGELKIHYSYTQSRNPNQQLIFISPGRTESYLKYKELVYDLSQQGYDVVVIDHRGQGLSDRTSSAWQLGDVASYQDYVADLHQLYQMITQQNQYRHQYLLSHSMGGTIGALYLLNYPNHFDAAVLCSPMFGIELEPTVPTWIAYPFVHLMARINQSRGHGPDYSLGQGPYSNKPFDKNQLTHSLVRYQIFRDQFQVTPQLKLGGPSYRWVAQSLIAMDRLMKQAFSMTTPMLILSSGQDTVVSNKAQQKFCHSSPKGNCTIKTIQGARHELFIEQDEQRVEAITLALDFLERFNI